MAGVSSDQASPKTQPLWIALIVVAVVAIVLGGFAALFYYDLVGIGQCDGGLAPGGPGCLTSPLELEQLGESREVNGTYTASILITPGSETVHLSTDLTISAWNDSGKDVPLLSVTLDSTGGRVLANFSASESNWTTTQSVEILWSEVLNVTSSTALAGQIVTVADMADYHFGPFPCLID
jgi:hypothetical protein